MYIERFYDDANKADAVVACARLLLLFVNRMLLRNWVEFGGLVLLRWVFFYLIIKTSVVGVAFSNAFFVTNGDEFYEHIL